jgi:aminopeptidase N
MFIPLLNWNLVFKECVSKSLALFQTWMSNPETNPIHPDIRGVVYTSAVRHGNESHWNFLWSRYVVEKFDSERDKILAALGGPTNTESIVQYLEETITDSVRINDAVTAYLGIGAYSPGKRIMFRWLQDNWDKVRGRFGERFADTIVTMVKRFINLE